MGRSLKQVEQWARVRGYSVSRAVRCPGYRVGPVGAPSPWHVCWQPTLAAVQTVIRWRVARPERMRKQQEEDIRKVMV